MSKHFKMYITITDIVGEKRIDLAFLIKGKELAIVSMFNDNVQYRIRNSVKLLPKTVQKEELLKGVYTDREVDLYVGLKLKSQLVSCDYIKRNKLAGVTEMVISLDELDNTDNLEDGNSVMSYLGIT